MAQPYDYTLNVPSPMQAFGQAFKVGAAGQRIVLEQAAARETSGKSARKKATGW